MRFSLVVATRGRVEPLERLVASLREQTHQDFELILVDQNGDDRLLPLVSSCRDRLRLIHTRSQPGATISRNAGMRLTTGQIIAFPDDDCWYEPNTLAKAIEGLNQFPDADGILVRCLNDLGEPLTAANITDVTRVDRNNVFHIGLMISMFIKADLVKDLGGFDERLGPGPRPDWIGGEETDLLLRLMKVGAEIWFWPSARVWHPRWPEQSDAKALDRRNRNIVGLMAVMKRHGYRITTPVAALTDGFFGFVSRLRKGKVKHLHDFHSGVFSVLKGWFFSDARKMPKHLMDRVNALRLARQNRSG